MGKQIFSSLFILIKSLLLKQSIDVYLVHIPTAMECNGSIRSSWSEIDCLLKKLMP